MAVTGLYRKATSSAPISIPGITLEPITVELNEEDVFDEGKARRDAINGFENVWTTIDWAVQGCVKNSPLWKSVSRTRPRTIAAFDNTPWSISCNSMSCRCTS